MIEAGNNSNGSIDEPETNLSPPRFDERAAANAQPVQPLPSSRVSEWRNRGVSFLRMVTGGSRAFVLVVIIGLVTGTLAGMAWVKEPLATQASPLAEADSEVGPVDVETEALQAEIFGMTDSQRNRIGINGLRKARSRPRTNHAPRAYRVAVLR